MIQLIEIFEPIIEKTPPGKAPIWFCNVYYTVRTNKIFDQYRADRQVLKGAFHDIKKSDMAKRHILKSYFDAHANIGRKIKEFDLSRISIHEIKILHFMGYGPIED